MPVLILRALECVSTEDYSGSDSCRLDVYVDGVGPTRMYRELNEVRELNDGQRWLLNVSIPFNDLVRIRLWDEDPIWDDDLAVFVIHSDIVHRGEMTRNEVMAFPLVDSPAQYILWYEVIDPVEAHRLTNISLRRMLGRLGQGVLTNEEYRELMSASLYRCSQLISVRDMFGLHAAQDRGKGNTNSVRTWIARHCNPWGEESIIPLDATLPQAIGGWTEGINADLWKAVNDEKTYCVGGLQLSSWPSVEDNPTNHATMDWCWNQILDPQFTYLHNYTNKMRTLSSGLQFPCMHNELEGGSMPIQWRPFCGEYVTTYGRYVYDKAHLPVKAEIHPGSTIVREYTTVDGLGENGALVPVNLAIIGMGLSGGFPGGNIGSRWDEETGGVPEELRADWRSDSRTCWFTNLKKHPLRYSIYPPVPRPSPSAQLIGRVVFCEYILVPGWREVADFLGLCAEDDPEGDDPQRGARGFRSWDRSRGLPTGFTPQDVPEALKPKLTLRHDSYFDVEIDLTSLRTETEIPVGYYAKVECGWSELGSHTLYGFDVTFETLKALTITSDDWKDDWHLYYGVNGQWNAWRKYDYVSEGGNYNLNSKFTIFTIDDMPISIRDCGIERDEFLYSNERLDRVSITAPGPNHFDRILENKDKNITFAISSAGSPLRFNVQGLKGQTKHEWTIQIMRFL